MYDPCLGRKGMEEYCCLFHQNGMGVNEPRTQPSAWCLPNLSDVGHPAKGPNYASPQGSLSHVCGICAQIGYASHPADILPFILCFLWPKRNSLGTSGPEGSGVVLGIVSKQTSCEGGGTQDWKQPILPFHTLQQCVGEGASLSLKRKRAWLSSSSPNPHGNSRLPGSKLLEMLQLLRR